MLSVVVMEPETPGNLGAIARVMKNFDCTSLYIINPKFPLTHPDAVHRSKHASDVLKNAKLIQWTDLKKFHTIIATTAKLGTDFNLLRTPITPEQLSLAIPNNVLSTNPKSKTSVAILLGREGSGLSNDEIESCDFLVTIPSSKKYPALNISHALTILLYEIYKKAGVNKLNNHILPSGNSEKRQMEKMFSAILDQIDFPTVSKRETQKKVWKHILNRSFLSNREVFAVMGFLRRISK